MEMTRDQSNTLCVPYQRLGRTTVSSLVLAVVVELSLGAGGFWDQLEQIGASNQRQKETAEERSFLTPGSHWMRSGSCGIGVCRHMWETVSQTAFHSMGSWMVHVGGKKTLLRSVLIT